MTAFLIAIAVLIGGYFIYGMVIERVFGIDPKRLTPAYTRTDGIDYIPLSPWRVFLIQFLNIAGLGPIFGAIMGIMFGPAAFLWITFGTIFAGAVHDYLSGMISLRSGGASLSEIVGQELGPGVKNVMRGWSVVLLILVGAVFVISPAGIIDDITPDANDRLIWVGVIFIYYMLATLLPIDRLIGRLYPIFGAALLFMAVALLVVMIAGGMTIPDGFSDGLSSRYGDDTHMIFPMMFVSIACGAISGFHATQSPMMARCLTNERLARPIFYGAMVAEGLVALIWAAAAIAFTGSYGSLHQYMTEHGANAGALVREISVTWLGDLGGILALLGVVAAPITTGDTALRSTRLMVADMLHIDQKKITKRLLISIPIFALTFLIMCIDFNVLWRYFAWCNQSLAVFTLWAVTVYLARHGKAYVVTLLPAMFMTAVTVSYLIFAPRPEGFGLGFGVAVAAGSAVAIALMLLFMSKIPKFRGLRYPGEE
ncbi:MAG: carbon starvation protein A [Muribaculaceae bacterium]